MVFLKKFENLTSENLIELNLKELDNIFSKSKLPNEDELDGIYKGTVLVTTGSDYLPSLVKKYLLFIQKVFCYPRKVRNLEKD